jgi:thiamine pyrophosphokinase
MPAEGVMGSLALVVAGGDPPPDHAFRDLPVPDVVIAADSGLHYARDADLAVDLVVGDLDSVDPDVLAVAIAQGVTIEAHEAAKDATDLELALRAARDRECTRVIVIGGHGGRVDHFLANALLLASPEFSALAIEARLGDAYVRVVRDAADFHGAPRDVLSLIPVGGAAYGVRTEGLFYPLRGETLYPGSTRGISNEFLGGVATVALDDGVLLAIVPHAVTPRALGRPS